MNRWGQRLFDTQKKMREKTVENRELKQTTLNRYTYVDEADGKRYLRRYDALRLYVGYHKDRESALVQVTDTTCEDGWVHYHLRRDRGQVPVTRRCLKPGEDFSPDEFIGAVADELRDALEGLVEE